MVLPWIDVAIAAHKAGFRGEAAANIIAISQPESGRQPERIVPEPSTPEVPEDNESYGLTCVNKLWVLDGHFTKEELLTADGNMRAAWIISERGTNFSPWMTFRDGLHKPYLVVAKAVMYDRTLLTARDIRIAALQGDVAQLQAYLDAERVKSAALQTKIDAALAALQ